MFFFYFFTYYEKNKKNISFIVYPTRGKVVALQGPWKALEEDKLATFLHTAGSGAIHRATIKNLKDL